MVRLVVMVVTPQTQHLGPSVITTTTTVPVV